MSAELVEIQNMLGELEEDRLLSAVRSSLAAGDDPMAIVEACRAGMEEVAPTTQASLWKNCHAP